MTFDEILYKSHNTLIKMLEQKYDGMTNGEVIESLFPNVGTNFSNVLDLNLWWKAKYKLKNEIHCNCTDEEIAKSFIEDVKAVEDLLPPVTPQPKIGHWIEEVDDYVEVMRWHCDRCYEDSGFTTTCKWDYCPNCGAKMEVE
jgi:hypothetical protein